MYILITKKLKVSKAHLIIKGGLYKVLKEKETKYRIRSYITDTRIWVSKDCCKTISGKPKFRYKYLAQVIKFLELYKWHSIYNDGVKTFDGKFTVEESMLHKFKYQSPFCHVFRKFSVDKGTDVKYCYCPLQHFDKSYAVTKNKTTNKKRRNCKVKKVDGVKVILSEREIFKKIQSITIEEIVEMLKQIKIPQSTLSLLRGFYFAHIWYEIKRKGIVL